MIRYAGLSLLGWRCGGRRVIRQPVPSFYIIGNTVAGSRHTADERAQPRGGAHAARVVRRMVDLRRRRTVTWLTQGREKARGTARV